MNATRNIVRTYETSVEKRYQDENTVIVFRDSDTQITHEAELNPDRTKILIRQLQWSLSLNPKPKPRGKK